MRDSRERDFSGLKSESSGIVAIIVITVAITLAIEILLACILQGWELSTKAYEIAQILASLFVIAGIIVATRQYVLSKRTSEKEVVIEQVHKAVELSGYYKDSILAKYPPMRYVFDKCGAGDIIRSIDPDKMRCFDKEEGISLLSDKDRDRLKDITSDPVFFEGLIEANAVFKLGLEPTFFREGKEDGDGIKVSLDSMVYEFMSDYVTDTLNNLEYFSMFFTHNIADESVVYQSLHCSYIEIVEYLYYQIAKLNDKPYDRLYTNVVELYKKWKNKCVADEMAHCEVKERFHNKGTVITNN